MTDEAPRRPAAGSPSWARDHLANERTLLAWLRTALTFMAFGVALAKFGLVLRAVMADHPELSAELPSAMESRIMGALLIVLGGAFALIGAIKTRRWAQRIEPEGAPPTRRTMTGMTAATVAASLLLVIYVVL